MSLNKTLFTAIFLIANLFQVHSESIYNDGNNGEYASYSFGEYSLAYSPYSYSTFSAAEDAPDSFQPFSQGTAQLRGAPAGFSGNPLGVMEEPEFPVGNLFPLFLFAGLYVFRVALRRK